MGRLKRHDKPPVRRHLTGKKARKVAARGRPRIGIPYSVRGFGWVTVLMLDKDEVVVDQHGDSLGITGYRNGKPIRGCTHQKKRTIPLAVFMANAKPYRGTTHTRDVGWARDAQRQLRAKGVPFVVRPSGGDR